MIRRSKKTYDFKNDNSFSDLKQVLSPYTRRGIVISIEGIPSNNSIAKVTIKERRGNYWRTIHRRLRQYGYKVLAGKNSFLGRSKLQRPNHSIAHEVVLFVSVPNPPNNPDPFSPPIPTDPKKGE